VGSEEALSLALQQKLNELMSRSNWQRTVDIGVDWLVLGITPKATSLKTDWSKPFRVDRPSVFQLQSGGVDVSHLVYLTHVSPDDTMVSEGRCRRNDVGRGFCLQVGDWYCYVPQLTGDPATFSARISDASSDLPSQQAALEGGGAAPGVQIVATLNRSLPRFKKHTSAVPLTATQFPAQAVPGGFRITVSPFPGNTGNVFVAETQAKAQAAGHPDCWTFAPGGAPISLNLGDWSALWLDVAVGGEGVQVGSEV